MKKGYLPLELEFVSCCAESVMAVSNGETEVDTGYEKNPFNGDDSNYETAKP